MSFAAPRPDLVVLKHLATGSEFARTNFLKIGKDKIPKFVDFRSMRLNSLYQGYAEFSFGDVVER